MFSLISKLFGDPSDKKLKSYRKELEAIKSIEKRYRDEIKTVEQVQARTHEFQSKFSELSISEPEDIKEIKKRLNDIKYEAFALHRRACEIIHGKEFEF